MKHTGMSKIPIIIKKMVFHNEQNIQGNDVIVDWGHYGNSFQISAILTSATINIPVYNLDVVVSYLQKVPKFIKKCFNSIISLKGTSLNIHIKYLKPSILSCGFYFIVL